MSKVLKRVKLVAIDTCGIPVKESNWEDRVMFISRKPDRVINVAPYYINQEEFFKLVTSTGEYSLRKNIAGNYWFSTCAGIEVEVHLKELTGELRYWV